MPVFAQRLYRQWILLLLVCVCCSFVPQTTQAQQPQPPAPPVDYGLRPLNGQSSQTTVSADGVTATTSDTPSDLSDASKATAAVTDTAMVQRSVSPQQINLSAPVLAAAPEATDDVRVDVSAPVEVRAAQTINYTYLYTNTKSIVSNITLNVTWTDFNPNVNGNKQFCLGSGTDAACVPNSVVGPGATKVSCDSSGCIYRVDQLPGNSAGRFSVRLGVSRDIFPRTGQAIQRPASSAQLFIGSETTVTSRDTANTLVVGPVLVLKKAALDPAKKIYATKATSQRAADPNEQSTFVISLSNGNGTGDVVGNQVRADARDANNIVLIDRFPEASAYVSAQSPTGIAAPTVDTNARTITWVIPGPLKPSVQDALQFRVTFRKDDVRGDCELLNNIAYTATSNEYPLDDGGAHIPVGGPSAATPVIIPLRFTNIKIVPDTTFYGGQASVSFTVQNYYDQAINGLQIYYNLQTNAIYSSASPSPTTTPTANTPGGRVTWQFNMPAGSKTTPAEKTFTVQLTATYTSKGNAGLLQFAPPTNADLPTACLGTQDIAINFRPRLLVKKFSEEDPTTKIGDTFIVKRGQVFNYVITVVNRGNATAQDIDIVDQLPNNDGANLTYKVGSATLNGQVRNPDSYTDGRGGSIFWNNLSLEGGKTLTIRYTLVVNGYDYANYCNGVTAVSGNSDDEGIDYDQRNVCVKINPAIVITKTINGSADPAIVNPGDEVTFRLTITNNEASTYRVGLVDQLGQFIYTKRVSSYDNAEPTVSGSNLLWSIVDLVPGQMREVVFKARVPTDCVTRDYPNEALFQSANTPGYVIYPIPRMIVLARVNCGNVEFAKSASTDRVSLKDRLVYTLAAHNADSKTASGVQVEDVLPQGFAFVGMDAGSGVTNLPTTKTLSDGRLQLSWTIPTINGNATVQIKYIALSSIIVGRADSDKANLLRTTPGACTGNCVTYNNNVYTFRSVEVAPLITAEPKVTPNACATPGDLRTYQVTVVNTNAHAYSKTTVAVTLPLGLHYVRPISSTLTPGVSTNANGDTMLTWQDLIIPQKPDNVVAAQVQLVVELKVGNVWGDLPTQVQTISPDGAIPRKDGVVDPIIPVCPKVSAIAKDVDLSAAEAGHELLYQIAVANPTSTDLKGVVVEDVLPAGLTFVRQVQGSAPTQSASKLTWTVDVPKAAAANKPGTVLLKFRVKIAANATKGTEYTNAATALSGTTALDKTYNSVKTRVVVFNKRYLPIMSR